MQDAENIADISIGIVTKLLDAGMDQEQIREYLNSIDVKPTYNNGLLGMGLNRLSMPYTINALGIKTKVYIVLINTCADNKGKFIAVNYDTVLDAIKTSDKQVLNSYIYHELGHLTNAAKSSFEPSETSIDFKNPMFLHLEDSEYKKITRMLYRFHTRELKARCFETKMFLEKNNDDNITIQDIYDNRCSDITLMRNFIDILKNGAKEGPQSTNGKILSDVSKDTWEQAWGDRRQFGDNEARWKLKCKNTIRYFQKRLDWFKKRIDKIFYDFKSKKMTEIKTRTKSGIRLTEGDIRRIVNQSVKRTLYGL